MKQLMSIINYCSPYLLTVEEDRPLDEVMKLMEEAEVRHLPVVSKGHAIGLLSQRDLKIFENIELAKRFTAEDVMVRDIFITNEETDLANVVRVMVEKKYGSCLVRRKDGKISGIFTAIDGLRLLKDFLVKEDEGLWQ